MKIHLDVILSFFRVSSMAKAKKKRQYVSFSPCIEYICTWLSQKGNLVIKIRWMVKNPQRKKSSYIIIISDVFVREPNLNMFILES